MGGFIWKDGKPVASSIVRFRVPERFKNSSSSLRELLGLLDFFKKHMSKFSAGEGVTFVCDNWGTILALLDKGSSVDPIMNDLICKFHSVLNSSGVKYSAVWSQRTCPLVVLADSLTRPSDNIAFSWKPSALRTMFKHVKSPFLNIGLTSDEIRNLGNHFWLEKKHEHLSRASFLYVAPHEVDAIVHLFKFLKTFCLKGVCILPCWKSKLNLYQFLRSSNCVSHHSFKWSKVLSSCNKRWTHYKGLIISFNFKNSKPT